MHSKQEATAEAREVFAKGGSLEEIITLLRQRGLTKMESMQVLEDDLEVSHRDAKLAVHQSEAWSENRQAAEELEERLLRPDGE